MVPQEQVCGWLSLLSSSICVHSIMIWLCLAVLIGFLIVHASHSGDTCNTFSVCNNRHFVTATQHTTQRIEGRVTLRSRCVPAARDASIQSNKYMLRSAGICERNMLVVGSVTTMLKSKVPRVEQSRPQHVTKHQNNMSNSQRSYIPSVWTAPPAHCWRPYMSARG